LHFFYFEYIIVLLKQGVFMSAVMKQEKQKNQDWANKTFSEGEKAKILDKLITARVGLLLRHPFFGNLATRMKMIDASEWCKTLATDGRNFYYNLGFVNKLTPKECEFGFAHEVLHNVFDHMGRRDGRDPQLSNIAADFAANQILKDERIGTVPSFIKIFQDDKYRGWSYEQIYQELYDKADKIDISQLGDLLDEHLDGEGDDSDGDGEDGDQDGKGKGRPKLSAEDKKKIRDEIKEAMVAAAQSAGAGKVPAGIARMITDFTEPKMDWRQMLRMNIQSILKSNFSFSRPNRKSQHCGAILPGMMNEETIDVSVAIDMSGSISDKMAMDFLSEVKGIMDEYKDFKLDLWCFDTDVYGYERFTGDTADDIMYYKCKGGGGTAFEANWDFMKEEGIEPKKFIMFTDGYPCGSWGDEDYCDTIFVVHGNDAIIAPFGQTAHYK
jgi:predicted metal-dependent peptidase